MVEYIVENALVLVPVLNVIGMIIKNTEKIPDKYIPLILLFFGVLGTIAILGLTPHSVVQGVLVTGAAVYGNQIVKQLKKE
ncbi:MAG: phage holin family protein [Clostridia bacterium]|nr:phage holin family protein [Clostridia bacterium]MBR5544084.1 phage holin family protein [Clostridia bacterium]